METRNRVWKEFSGGRKRGSGKPEAKIITRNIIQAVLVYKAAPYEIQRHIQTYRPTSCSTLEYNTGHFLRQGDGRRKAVVTVVHSFAT